MSEIKILLLTDTVNHEGETQLITKFFENGLDILHIRKPNMSRSKLEAYIQEIPEKFWGQIVIHGYFELAIKYKLRGIHASKSKRKSKFFKWVRLPYLRLKMPSLQVSTSFHHLASLYEETTPYDYVFLSPIFDSISKSGYQSGFSHQNLAMAVQRSKFKIMALGGVELDKIESLSEMKFHGAVLSGVIWQSENKLEVFKAIRLKVYDLIRKPV